MADSYITPNLELYEVLNAFPVIKNSLEKLHIKTSEIKEGLTVHDFLERKHLSEDEIDILVKKMNFEVNSFLKKEPKIQEIKEEALFEETTSDNKNSSEEELFEEE